MSNKSKRYIDLAELLKKERDGHRARQVEEVLGMDISIHEKIDRINRIDSRKDPEAEGYLSPGNDPVESGQDIHQIARRENLVTADMAERNRKRIKIRMPENDFLSFLFSDFRKIIGFTKRAGRKNDLVRYTWFPPGVRINRRLQTILETNIQPLALELIPVLNHVLHDGWVFLDKFEYNLLVRFQDLCRNIVSTNLRKLNVNDPNLVEKLSSLENLYFTCVYEMHYPDLITSSLETVVTRHPEWKYDLTRIRELVNRLLDSGKTRPSLQNIFLALNMVRYKRYLKLPDLIPDRSMAVISTFDYEADMDIKKNIQAFIAKKSQELGTLLKHRNEIKKVERFLPLTESGDFDFTVLKQYYGKYAGGKFDLDEDRTCPPQFLFHFTEMFLYTFEDLLIKEINLQDRKGVKIFTFEFFQYEVTRLRLMLDKMERYSYLFPKLTEERYISLVTSRKAGTQSEVELQQIMADTQSQLQAIADKLIEVDRYHIPPDSEEELLKLERSEPVPLEPAVLINRRHVIPCWDSTIAGDSLISEFTVHKVLIDMVTLVLLSSIVLHDTHLMSIISRRERIYRDISSVREQIRRVATVIEYRRIMKQYGLEGPPRQDEL
jgi:hypothetical protein